MRWMMLVPTILKSLPNHGVNYPILVGEETAGNAFGGVQFLPSTLYIGRDGKVVDKVFGLKKKNEIEEDIRALAKGQVTEARN
jgi:hypothetical protein